MCRVEAVERSDGGAGRWKQGLIRDGEDGRVIEGGDDRRARENECGGGRSVINVRKDRKI